MAISEPSPRRLPSRCATLASESPYPSRGCIRVVVIPEPGLGPAGPSRPLRPPPARPGPPLPARPGPVRLDAGAARAGPQVRAALAEATVWHEVKMPERLGGSSPPPQILILVSILILILLSSSASSASCITHEVKMPERLGGSAAPVPDTRAHARALSHTHPSHGHIRVMDAGAARRVGRARPPTHAHARTLSHTHPLPAPPLRSACTDRSSGCAPRKRTPGWATRVGPGGPERRGGGGRQEGGVQLGACLVAAVSES